MWNFSLDIKKRFVDVIPERAYFPKMCDYR